MPGGGGGPHLGEDELEGDLEPAEAQEEVPEGLGVRLQEVRVRHHLPPLQVQHLCGEGRGGGWASEHQDHCLGIGAGI